MLEDVRDPLVRDEDPEPVDGKTEPVGGLFHGVEFFFVHFVLFFRSPGRDAPDMRKPSAIDSMAVSTILSMLFPYRREAI